MTPRRDGDAGHGVPAGGGGAPVLSVRDLAVTFPSAQGAVEAVRGVSFDVHPGEVLAVVGESGSGKSVCALAIMGLLPPGARVGGQVLLRGEDLLGLAERRMAAIRGARVAMVFQDPMASLDPVVRVSDQIVEALVTHDRGLGRRAARQRAVELLQAVGIPDAQRRARAFPHELSGGMQQRVMIAMAIAHDPDVIVADEPTTALDATIQAQVVRLLRQVREETGAAVLLITHDLGLVAGMADRVQVMYAGRIVESGPARSLYYSPRHPYTSGLLASLPTVAARAQRRLQAIPGAPPDPVAVGGGCAFEPRCPLREPVCREDEPVLAGPAGHAARCHFSDRVAAIAPAAGGGDAG